MKWGLSDRSELVQKVAYKMFAEKWIVHADNNLIEFLERLEATKPAMTPLVEKLLKIFFKDRKDIVNEITFDGTFCFFFLLNLLPWKHINVSCR
jgi:condensin complex subunit 3